MPHESSITPIWVSGSLRPASSSSTESLSAFGETNIECRSLYEAYGTP